MHAGELYVHPEKPNILILGRYEPTASIGEIWFASIDGALVTTNVLVTEGGLQQSGHTLAPE